MKLTLERIKRLFYTNDMDTLEKLQSFAINMAFEAAEDVVVLTEKPSIDQDLQQLKERFPVTQACLPNGRTIPLLKTMQTSVCERDCNYCCFRSGRDAHRATLSPDELAKAVTQLSAAGIAKGVFLSSGIVGGGIRTQDRIIATAELLRNKYHYRDYIHLKIMPGAEEDQIFRAMQLADRVSINLEGPNPGSLSQLAPHKVFLEELVRPLKVVESIRQNFPAHLTWNQAWPSSTTQFVVGAVGETDLELLQTTANLQNSFHISRAYYSGFAPILDTPFENKPRINPWRQNRLYQAFFLLRDYHFDLEELLFSPDGNLGLEQDPKLAWAEAHLKHDPIEINTARYQDLLKIPGIGPATAKQILVKRQYGKIQDISTLRRFGAAASRAAPYILLDGHQAAYQPGLF